MKGIKLTDTCDLDITVRRDDTGLIVSGLTIDETTAQNQKLILLAQKGDFKEFPLLGVGISDYLDDTEADQLFREVREQFVSDGMRVSRLGVSGSGNIEVQAAYES